MQTLSTPSSKPATIILNTLAQAPANRPSDAEVAEVHLAVLEGREVPERVVDTIVDRLLKELSW